MEKPLQIQQDIPLAPFTTLKIGGNARYFIRAETELQVADAVRYAKAKRLKLFVLGGGSNALVSDSGFNGLVLQIALKGNQTDYIGNKVSITAGAGEEWDAFVQLCVSRDFAGLECLSGIPGSVGGTPVQNVGAYGQEVSESIISVRCLERETSSFIDLSVKECGFGYRTSIFNSSSRDLYIVLAVTYLLKMNGEPKVEYKDLLEHFDGGQPTLANVREAVLNIRRKKSMVLDDADPNFRSAGSFFKNPIIERDKLNEIRSEFEHIPNFVFGDKIKIPAAWLIENAGFYKGFSIGNAGISSNHTLALINRGNATSAEIIVLKERIQAAVAGKFGIDLQPEPVFIGF